jgi:hypothetical protein
MWSIDYVQVPVEIINKPPTIDLKELLVKPDNLQDIKEKRKADLVKQMSMSTDGSNGSNLVKSGSESSISEACDSVKETSKRFETEKDECSDSETQIVVNSPTTGGNDDENSLSSPPVKPKRRLSSAKSLHELKKDSSERDMDEVVTRRELMATSASSSKPKLRSVSHIETEESISEDSSVISNGKDDDVKLQSKGIRPSKSDTSLTDSFVVIDNEYGNKKKNASRQNLLRPGK